MSKDKARELVQPIMTCLYSSEQLKEQMQLMEYVDELHSAYLELEAKLAECIEALEDCRSARSAVAVDTIASECIAKVKNG